MNFKWNLLEFDLNLAKTLFKNLKRGPKGQRKCTVHISYVYNRGVYWSLLAPFPWVWHLWVVCVLILSFKLLFIYFFLFYCSTFIGCPICLYKGVGIYVSVQRIFSHFLLVSCTPAPSASFPFLGLSELCLTKISAPVISSFANILLPTVHIAGFFSF